MSLSWLFNNLVSVFLLPPLNGLLLIAIGWLVWHRRPRLARACVGFGLMLLTVLSLPVVGDTLLHSLEGEPLEAGRLAEAQAIVVLGGGRHRDAPEYGGDTVGSGSLVRVRYAARLHRQSQLPILVTGGRPDGGGLSEAETMRRALVEDFGVPVRWVEERSDNTRENALLSAEMLRREGISRVALVTHAWHMPRSQAAFEAAGLSVVPAPTVFTGTALSPFSFLPSTGGLALTRNALHEWLGRLWYRLRG